MSGFEYTMISFGVVIMVQLVGISRRLTLLILAVAASARVR